MVLIVTLGRSLRAATAAIAVEEEPAANQHNGEEHTNYDAHATSTTVGHKDLLCLERFQRGSGKRVPVAAPPPSLAAGQAVEHYATARSAIVNDMAQPESRAA